MRGSLGEKIGEGAFADVHAWAPGQVVKLPPGDGLCHAELHPGNVRQRDTSNAVAWTCRELVGIST
jgi:hypothetical protein